MATAGDILRAIMAQAWQPTQLDPTQEQAFQRDMQFAPGFSDWRKALMQRWHEQPNLQPGAPGDYDYRGAWLGDQPPQPYEHDNGNFHWTSQTDLPSGRMQELKAPNHPTRWMQTFMSRYGQDPYEASAKNLLDALNRLIVPNARGVGGQ